MRHTLVKDLDISMKNKFRLSWFENNLSLKLENATVDITMGENMKRVEVPNKVLCELCNNVLKTGLRGCTSLQTTYKCTILK